MKDKSHSPHWANIKKERSPPPPQPSRLKTQRRPLRKRVSTISKWTSKSGKTQNNRAKKNKVKLIRKIEFRFHLDELEWGCTRALHFEASSLQDLDINQFHGKVIHLFRYNKIKENNAYPSLNHLMSEAPLLLRRAIEYWTSTDRGSYSIGLLSKRLLEESLGKSARAGKAESLARTDSLSIELIHGQASLPLQLKGHRYKVGFMVITRNS